MAIAVGASDSNLLAASAATVTTAPVTTAASGSSFVVFSINFGDDNVASVTDSKGNTYTRIGVELDNAGDGFYMGAWQCTNGTGGASHTATLTLNGSTICGLYFIEITGGLTSGLVDVSNSAVDSDSGDGGFDAQVTPTAGNRLLLSFITGNGGGTVTYDGTAQSFTSVTAETSGADSMSGQVAQRVVAANGSTAYGPAFTASAGGRASVFTIALKEAAAGGTVNTQTLSDTTTITDGVVRSIARGAVLTDSLVIQDFLAWWWYRTRTLEDSIVVTEGQTETYTQYNAQMVDELTVTDELIWWLRRNRLLQDDIAITDELISNTIGYLIFVSVLTSNVTVTDQALDYTFFNRLLDSNLLTTDQALRALWVTRELIDAVSIDDQSMTAVQRFILLTDAISLEDALTASYIPETGPIVDNPIIRIGFDQPEIALGGYGLN